MVVTDKKQRVVQLTVEFPAVRESELQADVKAEAFMAMLKELFPKAEISKSIWEL